MDSKQNGLFYWQVGKVNVKLERKIQLYWVEMYWVNKYEYKNLTRKLQREK